MTNLLLNPDFEQPSSGDELQYQWFPGGALTMPNFTEIKPPRYWCAFWRDGFPGPGAPENLTGRPEVKHFSATIDPLRVHAGTHCAQLFTFWRPHDMGLLQRLRVQPGTHYTASVFAHAWYSHCSTKPHDRPLEKDCTTPLNWAWCRLAIGICPQGCTDPYSLTVIWGDGQYIYGQYANELTISNVKAQSDRITVFIRSITSHPLKHNDVYFDNAKLIAVGESDTGGPRIPYDRVYNVIRQDATLERANAIFATGWRRGKQTSGGSVDDAMLSPPGMGNVTAALWDVPVKEQNDLVDFRDTHYPDVHIVFEGEQPEPPDPPDPPSPPTHKTLLGLHLQTSVPGWLDYVAAVQPASIKTFQHGLAQDVKSVSPDTLTVVRHHIEHQGQFLDNPNPHDAAREFLSHFSDSLHANEQWIDYTEVLNETIGTHDFDGIPKAVKFESAFADVLWDSGIDVKPCLLNTAVGNPDHGVETELLLPAIEAAIRYGGAIGYHPYWWADPVDDGLQSWWLHHAGRALESWDVTFSEHGLEPDYLFTECGAIGSPDKGSLPNAAAGWRHGTCLANDWLRYRNQLLQFDSILAAWNATHNNRVLGTHIFTSGIGTGWEHFQLRDAELISLAEAINA